MAIVVLVLWLFTAGAGFSLLVTSNLSRARPTAPTTAADPAEPPPPAAEPATASVAATAQAASTAQATAATPAKPAKPEPADARPAPAGQAAAVPAQPTTKRQSRATRDRYAPPSLVAARKAPVVPGLRAVLEFAHPAFAVIGLGFWLGYTFVHYRPLGWIAFGLVTATIGLGLTWFAANTRAARRRLKRNREPQNDREPHNDREPQNDRGPQNDRQDASVPSFSARLIALHGGAAAMTVTLVALTAFVLGR